MNIVCVGGGPAGLYFALLARLRDPRNSVTVFERNAAGETFGWGVVLSDVALDTLALADAPSAAAIRGAFKRWDAIDVHVKGRTVTSSGHGFCGIGLRDAAYVAGYERWFAAKRASAGACSTACASRARCWPRPGPWPQPWPAGPPSPTA